MRCMPLGWLVLMVGWVFKQDESVRLWNVHTGICILIFAGAGGHRNEVLSVVGLERHAPFIHFIEVLYLNLHNGLII